MLLAEDLLLLLTDDETGRLVVTGSEMDIALGGAQLVELSMTGHVDVDEKKRLVVRDTTPTGDPVLDRSLATVREREGKKPSSVIGTLGRGLLGELYVHRAITSALVHRTTPEPRDGALIALLHALVHALRSTHKVVDPRPHDLRRKELDRRAKEVAEGNWGSTAVREAIDAMMAAVMVAVTASTAAAGAGSS